MVLRLKRDPRDKRAPERNLASFLASLLLHALAAYLLFSLATSSSEQAAPESTAGTAIVTVTREVPKKSAPVSVARAAVPVPHAPVVPRPRTAAQPRSAPPHPRVLHELAKFAPTAPPNPTPAPVSSAAPNPNPTQAQIAVTPAPIAAAVPTSVPANVAAVSVKTPPTAAPQPKPSALPTALPTHQPLPTAAPKAAPVTPAPQPSALVATAAPLIAATTPQPLVTPGSPSQVKIAQPAATPARGTAPTPGPKPVGSPGPRGVAPVKGPTLARPVQPLPATPKPAPVQAAPSKRATSLNQRLKNLIPTPAPSFTPAPPKRYSFLGNLKPTPVPEPTPPPDVLAATKFLFVENVGGQRWKQSYLGVSPEERYVKMYVTSVKRIGFIRWCTGWVLRAPITGDRKWVIEPNESLICSGDLAPFTQPSPEPSKGS